MLVRSGSMCLRGRCRTRQANPPSRSAIAITRAFDRRIRHWCHQEMLVRSGVVWLQELLRPQKKIRTIAHSFLRKDDCLALEAADCRLKGETIERSDKDCRRHPEG